MHLKGFSNSYCIRRSTLLWLLYAHTCCHVFIDGSFTSRCNVESTGRIFGNSHLMGMFGVNVCYSRVLSKTGHETSASLMDDTLNPYKLRPCQRKSILYSLTLTLFSGFGKLFPLVMMTFHSLYLTLKNVHYILHNCFLVKE